MEKKIPLRQTPTLDVARQSIVAARIQQAYYPSSMGYFSVSMDSVVRINRALMKMSRLPSIGLVGEWNIFIGGRNLYAVQELEALYESRHWQLKTKWDRKVKELAVETTNLHSFRR